MVKEKPVPQQSLGVRIRQLRRARGATLRQVAAAAEVSESFVSQVERGVTNPSLAALSRIANALQTNLSTLFIGTDPTGSVVRAAQRKRMAHPVGNEDYLLTPSSAKAIEIIYSVVGVGQGSGDEPYTHAADEECVVVITGRLEVGVGDQQHLLEAGDLLMFDPKSPHWYRNPGPDTMTALWVTSPPVY